MTMVHVHDNPRADCLKLFYYCLIPFFHSTLVSLVTRRPHGARPLLNWANKRRLSAHR